MTDKDHIMNPTVNRLTRGARSVIAVDCFIINHTCWISNRFCLSK